MIVASIALFSAPTIVNTGILMILLFNNYLANSWFFYMIVLFCGFLQWINKLRLLAIVLSKETFTKVAVFLDSFRQFQETTSDLNHFAREEIVLAGLRFIMQLLAERSSRLME
jgi:hypothetical protein